MNKEDEFKKEFLALCDRFQLAPIPMHNDKPNAHDPMIIVPLDDFWKHYLENRLYTLTYPLNDV